MTEFLIFLGMCGAFALAFRWFLGLPNSEARMKAHVAEEMAALRAKVAAEDAAKQQGFGRKSADQPAWTFVPSAGQFSLDLYDGKVPAMPFGRDLSVPDSRTVPALFQGTWLWEDGQEDRPEHHIVLTANAITRVDAIGPEPVVAVYTIDESNIAAVTQAMEDGRWRYAEHLYGLLEGGAKITDLENMDMRWNRLS